MRKKTEELREKEIQLQTNVANIEDASARLADENEKKKILIHELESA